VVLLCENLHVVWILVYQKQNHRALPVRGGEVGGGFNSDYARFSRVSVISKDLNNSSVIGTDRNGHPYAYGRMFVVPLNVFP